MKTRPYLYTLMAALAICIFLYFIFRNYNSCSSNKEDSDSTKVRDTTEQKITAYVFEHGADIRVEGGTCDGMFMDGDTLYVINKSPDMIIYCIPK